MADTNDEQVPFFIPVGTERTPENPDVFTNSQKRQDFFDIMVQNNNMPGYTSATVNAFRGFNPFSSGPAMMELSDNVIGLMFITRPQLNLADYNIYRSEKLISMAGAGANDLGGYLRGLLDNQWAAKTFGDQGHPMLDNNQPFITCLNEFLKTSTGFGDLQLRLNTTEPGLRQQVYQYVSSKIEENGTYTIQQTYHNPRPLLIQTMFQYWLTYISEVKSGDNELTPHMEYLLGNRCDHDCRIYHMVMNRDTEYLESLFASVRSIPQTFPAGAIADINRVQNTLRAENQDEFAVQFGSEGMRFDEISLINAFNEHVFLYNPALMQTINNGGQGTYRMLSISEYNDYRYMMYPLLIPTQQDIRGGTTNNVKQSFRQGIRLTWWTRKE